MIGDIRTVMWKECKEIFGLSGPSGRIRLLFIVGMFGVFLPLRIGADSVTSPMAVPLWGFVPILVLGGVIADSFAGERERHTLETLLASRLSDASVLYGKMAAAVGYGWGLTLAGLILTLITVNIANDGGGFLLYTATTATANLLVSLLGALLASAGGTLVSLRAQTVRQAQQTLALAILAMGVAPLFIVLALPNDLRRSISVWAVQAGALELLIIGIAILAVVDAVLIVAAKARFQRSKLAVG